MRFLSILLVFALIGVLGCGQQASDTPEQQAGQTEELTPPSKSDVVEAIAVNVGEEMTLMGTAGCGHCTFQKGESCAMAMKVADGSIFILDGIDEDTEAFNERTSGKPITVVGKVTEVGDPNHIMVDSYEM